MIRDTPSSGIGRRAFRARMRLASIDRQGTGCSAMDLSRGAWQVYAFDDPPYAGGLTSSSAAGVSSVLRRPGNEHSIVTALAVVQVEVPSTADPSQAGQRAAAIARRVRDEQRIAPAAAASIDPPTIRRHASVRSPKEVDRPLAIHWDADGDLSTVCAARFPLKAAATGGACVDESGMGQTFIPAFEGLASGSVFSVYEFRTARGGASRRRGALSGERCRHRARACCPGS